MKILINNKTFIFPKHRINIDRISIDCTHLSDEDILTTIPAPPAEEINWAREFGSCVICERMSTQETFNHCYEHYIQKIRSGEIKPFLLPSISKRFKESLKKDPMIKSYKTNSSGILSIKI